MRIFEPRGGVPGQKVAEGPSPLEETLDFDSSATRHLRSPSATGIAMPPARSCWSPKGKKQQEVYQLTLVQYFEDLKTHRFEPAMREGVLRSITVSSSPRPTSMQARNRRTSSASRSCRWRASRAILMVLDASPADNLLVYQVYTGESPGKLMAAEKADTMEEFLQMHPELDRNLVMRFQPGAVQGPVIRDKVESHGGSNLHQAGVPADGRQRRHAHRAGRRKLDECLPGL